MVIEAALVLVVEQLLWQETVPVCLLVVRDNYMLYSHDCTQPLMNV